ncbi:hypothetical protein, partial [Streptomyces sp. SID8352]|uniref:hypothetical protein n=1 Tax=Streptomyces sp. SID8352 TaxID=2690338 RepID=UPI001370B6B6
MPRLTFTLTGRDELTRVLNNTGDSADRLRLRMAGIVRASDGSLRTLQGQALTTDEALRRLDATAGGTRTSFTSLSDAGDKLGESIKSNLISLAPAVIPMAAALASSAAAVAGALGAGAVAAGAFGLALGPQIGKIGEAAQAQTKWEEALATSGRGSAEAGQAALDYQRALASLPPATREAAVAVGLLRSSYDEWSDSLSGDVMAPLTKGVAIANALLPKTTGLARGAAGQVDRLMTLLGGAVSTPGFDAMNQRFEEYATGTLDRGIDGLTRFLAKLDAGEYQGGPLAEFFDYSREVGPEVWETLENVGEALVHVLDAGADVGVGMLDVVNVLTGIASAVPPEALATLLQLAIAIKAVKLAAVGADAARAVLAQLGVQIGVMSAAARTSSTSLGAATAAVGALSRGAKLAMAGTGIGLLLVGLDMLTSGSEKPKPNVDRLTTSLTELAESGRLGGELVRAYGDDLSGLADAFQKVVDPQGLDQVQQSIIGFFGADSTPVKEAKENVDALDKALAGMVSGGRADLAAEALTYLTEETSAHGLSVDEVRGKLDNYQEALAGQALEQRLAAASMGIFGDQAIAVQAQLDAQKQSADGLRQSILALNDANRSAYDAQIGFEASIDALTESFEKNGSTLDLNTEKGRANGTAMSAAAKAHDEMLASGLAAGESLGSMSKKSDELREKMLKLAEATGLSDKEAADYVNTLLGVPSEIKTTIQAERQEALAGLREVESAINDTPSAKEVTVKTLSAAAIKALEAVGLKTRTLPDGQTEVYAATGVALGSIAAVETAIQKLDGDTANTYTNNYVRTYYDAVQRQTHGRTSAQMGRAQGGLVGGYAAGGPVQVAPDGLLSGPGTGTSDSILAIFASGAVARVSNAEFVVNAAATRKHLPLLTAINNGIGGFAGGGQIGGAAFRYAPTAPSAAQLSLSTVSGWYDQDVQRLKDAWTKLNEALRDQAKKSTAATRKAVADAQRAVNAADKALGLRAGSKVSGFSLTG